MRTNAFANPGTGSTSVPDWLEESAKPPVWKSYVLAGALLVSLLITLIVSSLGWS